jgi:hypothetical protein
MNKLNKYIIIIIGVIFISFFYNNFILLNRTFYHDTIVISATFSQYFQYSLKGEQALWSPYINGGMQIWPQIETMPYFDPAVQFSWNICKLLSCSNVISFSLVILFWNLALSYGIFFLSLKITKSFFASALILISTLFGPIFFSSLAQAQGFLLPFRYIPFLIFSFVIMREKIKFKYFLIFSLITFFSSSGYQSAYSWIYVYFLFFIIIIFDFFDNNKKLPRYAVIAVPILLLSSTVALLPTLVAFFEIKNKLYSVPHNEFLYSYYYNINKLITQLLLPINFTETWHGTGNNGFFTFLSLLGISYILSNKVNQRSADLSKDSINFGLGIFITLVIALLFIDKSSVFIFLKNSIGINIGREEKVLFGVRNWGFSLSYIHISIYILACYGILYLQNFKLNSFNYIHNQIFHFIIYILLLLLLIFFPRIMYYENNCEINDCKIEPLTYHGLFLFSTYIAFYYLAHLIIHKFKNVNLFLFTIIISYFIFQNYFIYFKENSFGLKVDKKLSDISELYSSNVNSIDFTRIKEFDSLKYAPYHYEGPTIYRIFAVIFNTKIKKLDSSYPVTALTHQFERLDYRIILSSLNSFYLEKLYNVGKPVIYIPKKLITTTDQELLNVWKSYSIYSNEFDIAVVYNNFNSIINLNSCDISSINFAGDSINFVTICNEYSFVVVGDTIDNNWAAYINNVNVDIIKVNGIFKGIYIPKGYSIIEFKYNPILYIFFQNLRFLYVIIIILLILLFYLHDKIFIHCFYKNCQWFFNPSYKINSNSVYDHICNLNFLSYIIFIFLIYLFCILIIFDHFFKTNWAKFFFEAAPTPLRALYTSVLLSYSLLN